MVCSTMGRAPRTSWSWVSTSAFTFRARAATLASTSFLPRAMASTSARPGLSMAPWASAQAMRSRSSPSADIAPAMRAPRPLGPMSPMARAASFQTLVGSFMSRSMSGSNPSLALSCPRAKDAPWRTYDLRWRSPLINSGTAGSPYWISAGKTRATSARVMLHTAL